MGEAPPEEDIAAVGLPEVVEAIVAAQLHVEVEVAGDNQGYKTGKTLRKEGGFLTASMNNNWCLLQRSV